jgi:ectoine hydroxylase
MTLANILVHPLWNTVVARVVIAGACHINLERCLETRGSIDAAGRYVAAGIVSPKGPAGSMILFHGCLVHASGSNLSPWDRVSVYLSLCAVSNHIRRFKRPEYLAHRDFTPIECLPDDCLLREYPVELPWRDGMPASALETSSDELKLAA